MISNTTIPRTEVKESVNEIAQQIAELLASSDLSFCEARLVLQNAWDLVESFTITVTDPRN